MPKASLTPTCSALSQLAACSQGLPLRACMWSPTPVCKRILHAPLASTFAMLWVSCPLQTLGHALPAALPLFSLLHYVAKLHIPCASQSTPSQSGVSHTVTQSGSPTASTGCTWLPGSLMLLVFLPSPASPGICHIPGFWNCTTYSKFIIL